MSGWPSLGPSPTHEDVVYIPFGRPESSSILHQCLHGNNLVHGMQHVAIPPRNTQRGLFYADTTVAIAASPVTPSTARTGRRLYCLDSPLPTQALGGDLPHVDLYWPRTSLCAEAHLLRRVGDTLKRILPSHRATQPPTKKPSKTWQSAPSRQPVPRYPTPTPQCLVLVHSMLFSPFRILSAAPPPPSDGSRFHMKKCCKIEW